ncbi:MAG: hypothetical protein AAGF33_18600 [Pseudomonadota bacterium]
MEQRAKPGGKTQPAVPDNIRSAGLTVTEERALLAEIERLSQRNRISEDTLLAVAENLFGTVNANDGYDIDLIIAEIQSNALRIVELESELALLAASNASPDTTLIDEVRAAITAGDLELADDKIAEVLALQQTELFNQQARIATTHFQRGRLAFLLSSAGFEPEI